MIQLWQQKDNGKKSDCILVLFLSLGIIIPGAARKTKVRERERRFFVGTGDEHKERKGGVHRSFKFKAVFYIQPGWVLNN